MNTLTCWAMVLIAVLLLPNAAASADAAKEAYQKGKACSDKQEYDAAITAFTEAIRLNPKDAKAYCSRGVAYGQKGEYDKLIADHTKVIRLAPKYAMAYYNRRHAYSNKGDTAKAEKDFAQAKKLRYRG